MGDVLFVEITQGQHHLSGDELDDVFREAFVLEVDLVELAATDEGHDEVEAELVLEEVVHADEEGVLQVHHDVHLRRRVFDLLLLDQDVFADGLDRIELAHARQLS